MTHQRIQRYGRDESCPVCVAAGADKPARSRCALTYGDDGDARYLCASASEDVPGFRCVGNDDGKFLGTCMFVAEDGHAPSRGAWHDYDDRIADDQAQPFYQTLVDLIREHAHAGLPLAQAETQRRGLAWSDDFLARPTSAEAVEITRGLLERHPELRTRNLRGLVRRKSYLRFPSQVSTGGELWIVLRDQHGRAVAILRRLLGSIISGKGKYRSMGPGRAAFVGTRCTSGTLLVAEGPIKAMIASQRLGVPAAATPSVVIARAVAADLRAYLKSRCPARVLLAPDAGDLRDGHPDVERAVVRSWRRIARAAAGVGAKVLWGWWATQKGIDDALVAGVEVDWLTWEEYVTRWAKPPTNDDDQTNDDGAHAELPRIPEPCVDPDTEAAREVLPLGDARVRIRDILDEASRRGVSLDAAGVAGIGKSYGAFGSEIDRQTALHGAPRSHALGVFTVGGGLDLVRERHATIETMVREHGAASEIAVRIALGRQPVEDENGEPAEIPPNSTPDQFGCVNSRESANRSRGGFHGCAGCLHAPGGPVLSMCESTPGAYLHDWAALRNAVRSGPTIIVTHAQTLPTFWSKIDRDGPNVRFYADDCDDVHFGLLHDFIASPSVLDAARRTANFGVHAVRRGTIAPGQGRLSALIARSRRCGSLGEPITTAAPDLVAWVLAATLTAFKPNPTGDGKFPRRDRLGAVLLSLARIPELQVYVVEHTFGRDLAWREHKRLGPDWSGLGIGALVWSLLRSVIASGGVPSVESRGEAGSAITSIDLRLVDAIQAGRVTRLGVTLLPASVRTALGFREAREIVVPVRASVIAVEHPRKSSWGKRSKQGGVRTLADHYTEAIADDLAAAHPGRMLLVGGLADEARDPRAYKVAVSGRDDRATNKFVGEIDGLLLRRLAYPMQAVLATVSALMAGLGLPRPPESEDDSVPVGRTPTGAILPLDEGVRAAWLAVRCSTVRNGIGRARAVLREDQVRLVALDQDLLRWPDLVLPGYRVTTCSIAQLAATLMTATPRTDAGQAEERRSHDPNPDRTAQRTAAVSSAFAAGARTIQEVSATTGIPSETLRRRGNARVLVVVPLEYFSLRGLRPEHARFVSCLAQLSHHDVVEFAAVCGVHPGTIRRWRSVARTIIGGRPTHPRTLATLDRALARLAEFTPTPPREASPNPARRRHAADAPATPMVATPVHDPTPTELDLLVRSIYRTVRLDQLPPVAEIVDRLPLEQAVWSMPRASARRTASRLLDAITRDLRGSGRALSRPNPVRQRRLADLAWDILELRPSPSVEAIDAEAARDRIRTIVEAADLTLDDFARALAIAAAASASGPPGVVMAAFRDTVGAGTS